MYFSQNVIKHHKTFRLRQHMQAARKELQADSSVRQGRVQQMFSKAHSFTLGVGMCDTEVTADSGERSLRGQFIRKAYMKSLVIQKQL